MELVTKYDYANYALRTIKKSDFEKKQNEFIKYI